MTRLYTEGFESGTVQNDPNILAGGYALVSGRRGGYALDVNPYPNNTPAYQAVLGSNPTEVWIRTAFYINSGQQVILSLGAAGVHEVTVLAGGGSPVVVQLNSNTVITSTRIILANTWYLIELHYKLATSGGQLDLKVEGTLEGSFSGNTAPLGSTAIARLYLWGNGRGFGNTSFDDIAVNDNTGVIDNSWCGDGYIVALQPHAQGNSNQWLRNDTNLSSVSNYDRVAEIPPDNASTYVYSQNIGDTDFYHITNLSGLLPADAIRRVWTVAYASEAVAGGDSFQVGLYTNGTAYWSPNKILSTNWEFFQGPVYTSNPNTLVAWTQADVNALQVGIKVV